MVMTLSILEMQKGVTDGDILEMTKMPPSSAVINPLTLSC